MDKEENRKKSIKDIKLAPTKGVRRPGAARSSVQQDTEPAFHRTSAPKARESASQQNPTARRPRYAQALISEDDELEMVVSARKISAPPRASQDSQKQSSYRSGTSQIPATSKVSLKKRKTWNTRIKNTGSTPKVLIIILLLIGIVFFSSFVSYTYLVDKYNNPISLDSIVIDTETAVSFKIEKGASTSDIAKSLKEQDLITNASIYRFLSKFNGYDGNYKAGTYTLCPGLNYEEIMVILTSNPESVKITIPEGFTTKQIANRLEANGCLLYTSDAADD